MNPLTAAWHHIRRSPFQSLVAIFIMFLCFFVVSSYLIVSNGMSSVLRYFETKPEVTIFLKDGLDKATVENLQKEIAAYPNIKEIKFISKEDALQIYKDQNKNNPMLTEMVTASVLPASFEVAVSDPKVLEQIASDMNTKTNVVDEIIYQKDVIKQILNWTNIIRKSGIVVISVLGFTSFLFIFVIVGMKITNRKEEIRVSRLLGASKYYVKRPFIFEGIFYGILGSLAGAFLSFGLAYYFQPKINTFFQPIQFIGNDYLYYATILGLQVFAGIFIGYVASWFGVKRYIKY
ncbi:MAG TPA: ABC transporter permease [Patescibacteria group bacterium]